MSVQLITNKFQKAFPADLIRFGIAGVINTGVDFSIYYLLISLLHSVHAELISKTTGIICGITSAFVLNSLWVFRRKFIAAYMQQAHKFKFVVVSYFKLLLSYSVGMISNVLIFLAMHKGGSPKILCLLTATIISSGINYVLSKKFVFA